MFSPPPRPWSSLAVGLLALSIATVPAAAGSLYYVDADAPSGGNGTSWALAFQSLDEAFVYASSGDTLWVAEGTYTPAPPGGSRTASFVLSNDMSIYGGFAGDEQSLDERDLTAHETRLSGDLNGDDGPGFENYDDNSFHVVRAANTASRITLDGVTIVGGSEPLPDGVGAAVHADGCDVSMRSCTVRENTSGLYCHQGDVTIDLCVFRRMASNPALVNTAGSVTVTATGFFDNESRIGTLSVDLADVTVLADCSFVGNASTESGGAARLANGGDTTVTRCVFRNNSTFHSNVFSYDQSVEFIDCIFAENTAQIISCVGLGSLTASFINCVFSRNEATGQPVSAAVVVAGPTVTAEFINCTFSKNFPSGIFNEWVPGTVIRNSIFWGNWPDQINGPTPPDILFSIVEGGWPGSSNLDADPLFVQPGTDNVRLSTGSPALDAGSNAYVPVDVLTDLDGNPRIQNFVVDMGAYEGEHDPLPPAAAHMDIDAGEIAVLLPDGDELNALENTLVAFENVSECDDATATATEHEEDVHPAAEGYSGGARTLSLETSLDEGQFLATIARPFDADHLQGADPLSMNLTCYDGTVGNWALAVFANTVPSPGHASPIGDRIAVVGPGFPGITQDVGDYGVYWDPALEQGIVWANVDHVRDTGYGVALCPPDCAQPPDGATAFRDMLAVIHAWGAGAGPFDVNGDGVVNVADLLAVISNWGTCP
ncbi:MAG: right-handed parallel beta-helix repeat-containing protein [Planctomycetota bacterium]|jgi:hypothetical protein